MKISIIVPFYNAEKYLKRCIEGILNQTYDNIEVILVNDGSTDNSDKICNSYATKDERIIYMYQENKGPAIARNTGIKLATGHYIGFVDADDFIESDMYECLIGPTSNGPLDVVICHFKIFKNGNYSIPRTTLPVEKKLKTLDIKKILFKSYYEKNDQIIPSLCNKIYNREFLNKYSLLIDTNRVRAEDYWFNFNVFKNAKSVYIVEGVFYNYYDNQNSIMKTFRENQFDLFLETQKQLIQENIYLKFQINNQKFNQPFIDNTNEYIILAIQQKGFLKGYNFVFKILNNMEFIRGFNYVNSSRLHMKIIKTLLNCKMIFISYLVYALWGFKSRINNLN